MKAFTVLISFILMAQISWAEVTPETQTLLIKKLTNVFLKLPDGNPTKTKITLRLADLHAERGRLISKRELEKGCIECSNGEVDRKKALEYYLYVMPNLKGEQRHNVLVQIGHIYEVLGQNNKAISLYKKVISGSTDGRGMAESLFSIGEIYFKRKDFKSAQTYYKKALGNSYFTRRGLASYRLAWCQYNSGQISSAVNGLEKILTTPKLLTRGGEEVVNVDLDFKAEVAKDFTVFVAHSSQLNSASIQKVYKYSPDKSRIENVSYLAKELERLGRIKTAQETWELVVAKTDDPQIRMEGLIYLAGLQLKGSQKQKIAPYLKRAFQNWNSLASCKDQEQCNVLKKRVRRLVFD
ncbi:MAG: tetratricopeptide repeat protein, partial [Bdellovibrionales bacterium]|nr:tetratricopeptide repeat protein [Bdellovibrionales bacterium]NQZ18860.1 tetratricopeptide repeat protein [Bdellovibrionales bacterium]